MKVLTECAVALLIAGGLATPALAAATTPTNDQKPATTNQNQTSSEKAMSVRNQIVSDLSKAGFNDIKVMPEFLLVRAKDSRGNPVMMVINPDSVTTVSEIAAPKNASTASNAGNQSGNHVLSGANANGDPTPPAKQ